MKTEKERGKQEKADEEKNHRRDGLLAEGYESAGRVKLSSDTTSEDGSPRVGLP